MNPATGCSRKKQGGFKLFNFWPALLASLLVEEGSPSTLKPSPILYAPQIHSVLTLSSILHVFDSTGRLYPRIIMIDNFKPSLTDHAQNQIF
jgi:hypothetical protein